MTKPHRATPEQWAITEEWAADNLSCYSCILELRARIEKLELANGSLPSEEEQDYETYIAEHERWKPIAGYEGYYMISSLGRIKSEDRTIPHQKTGSRFISGKVLKTGLRPNGYTMIVLRKENKKETRTIHTLVAEAFIGPRPEGMLVCHGSGGKQDNRVENLYYGTPEQNNGPDKQRDGTLLIGERNHRSSLTDEDVIAIRKSNAKGVTLANIYRVSEQCISDIRNNRRWTHLPSMELLKAHQNAPTTTEHRPGGLVKWVEAALAQPAPQAPTDKDLDALERKHWKLDSVVEYDPSEGFSEVFPKEETFDHRAFARAVLARWGSPANTTREKKTNGSHASRQH
jgi:hypothetical protein